MSLAKRTLDISLATLGLIVALPVMLVIAFCIRLESPGEIIFSQRRLGKGGKYFNIHKFRKFPADWGTKGAGVTTQGDVRMTSVGAFLERTKLDELPQLWNILKGEMSFVGPRPESARYESLFVGEYRTLLDYTPGIFGPNQVAFRNEAQMYPDDEDPEEFYKRELFPKKALSDISYFQNASFFSDFTWILKGLFGTLYGAVNWRRFVALHWLIIIADLVLFQLSWLAAHAFRFGFPVEARFMVPYQTGVWLLPLIILPAMHLIGCYRHPVRYFSVADLSRLLVAVPAVWAFATLIEIYFYHRFMSISVSALGLILFLTSIITIRTLRREHWHRHGVIAIDGNTQSQERSVVIYGANKKGHALAKFLESFAHVSITGFIDNDEALRGRFLNGRKVYGHWRDIDTIKTRVEFNEMWICIDLPAADRDIVRDWAVHNDVTVSYLSEFIGD